MIRKRLEKSTADAYELDTQEGLKVHFEDD